MRTLIPLGLVVKAGRWYLAAQAPGGSPRTYRVARIRSAEPQYLRATPPPQFHLGRYWESSQEEFARSVRSVMVRLRLPLTRAEDLMRAVPGSITEEALEAARVTGETMEIELPMENTEVAVSQLITVPDLTVVAPMPLRRGLHDHARAAAERHR